ncbi:MAG: phosphoribosylformylglycinamidine synthase subunit PurS, partial [Gemmatimonadota bacterium]
NEGRGDGRGAGGRGVKGLGTCARGEHVNDYKVEIRIMPRQGLLDPQGKAVENALRSLEFQGVSGVRIGRLVRLSVAADSVDTARARADEMCRKLLANPVTEDYEVEVCG